MLQGLVIEHTHMTTNRDRESQRFLHLMRLHAAVLKREVAIEPAVTTRKTYEWLMRAENEPAVRRNAW